MSSPDLTLEVPRPERLFSDGSQLLVTSASEGTVSAYDLATLAADSAPVVIHGPAGDTFAAPGDAMVADGKLYVADSFKHRVFVWASVAAAAANDAPLAVLGNPDPFAPMKPNYADSDDLHLPQALAWDGSRLWVGEFKFSQRLLRFTPIQ